ncbi:MAG: hypothetical protein IJK28_07565 [Clostridia bacterium]|nr:hypothetical protein [Clostridia bacterium]
MNSCILTADDLIQMDLDSLSESELKQLLPNVIDLYDNIDATTVDNDELPEEELEEIRIDLKEKADEVERILQVIRSRLGPTQTE